MVSVMYKAMVITEMIIPATAKPLGVLNAPAIDNPNPTIHNNQPKIGNQPKRKLKIEITNPEIPNTLDLGCSIFGVEKSITYYFKLIYSSSLPVISRNPSP